MKQPGPFQRDLPAIQLWHPGCTGIPKHEVIPTLRLAIWDGGSDKRADFRSLLVTSDGVLGRSSWAKCKLVAQTANSRSNLFVTLRVRRNFVALLGQQMMVADSQLMQKGS